MVRLPEAAERELVRDATVDALAGLCVAGLVVVSLVVRVVGVVVSVSVVFLEAAGAVFGSAAAFGTAAETPGASRPGTVPSLSGKPVTGPTVLAGTAISGPTVVCDSPTAVIAM